MKGEVWPPAGKTFLGFAFVAGVVTWLEESEPATAGKGTKASGTVALVSLKCLECSSCVLYHFKRKDFGRTCYSEFFIFRLFLGEKTKEQSQ